MKTKTCELCDKCIATTAIKNIHNGKVVAVSECKHEWKRHMSDEYRIVCVKCGVQESECVAGILVDYQKENSNLHAKLVIEKKKSERYYDELNCEKDSSANLSKENILLRRERAELSGKIRQAQKEISNIGIEWAETCLECDNFEPMALQAENEDLKKELQQSQNRERVLREAVNSLIGLCENVGDFSNGNTCQGIDEGNVMAGRFIDYIKSNIKALEDKP